MTPTPVAVVAAVLDKVQLDTDESTITLTGKNTGPDELLVGGFDYQIVDDAKSAPQVVNLTLSNDLDRGTSSPPGTVISVTIAGVTTTLVVWDSTPVPQGALAGAYYIDLSAATGNTRSEAIVAALKVAIEADHGITPNGSQTILGSVVQGRASFDDETGEPTFSPSTGLNANTLQFTAADVGKEVMGFVDAITGTITASVVVSGAPLAFASLLTIADGTASYLSGEDQATINAQTGQGHAQTGRDEGVLSLSGDGATGGASGDDFTFQKSVFEYGPERNVAVSVFNEDDTKLRVDLGVESLDSGFKFSRVSLDIRLTAFGTDRTIGLGSFGSEFDSVHQWFELVNTFGRDLSTPPKSPFTDLELQPDGSVVLTLRSDYRYDFFGNSGQLRVGSIDGFIRVQPLEETLVDQPYHPGEFDGMLDIDEEVVLGVEAQELGQSVINPGDGEDAGTDPSYFGDAEGLGQSGVDQSFTNPDSGYDATPASPQFNGEDANDGDEALASVAPGVYDSDGNLTLNDGQDTVIPDQDKIALGDGSGEDDGGVAGEAPGSLVGGGDGKLGLEQTEEGNPPFVWDASISALLEVGAGHDLIYNFQVGNDKIALEAGLADSTLNGGIDIIAGENGAAFDLSLNEFGLVTAADTTLDVDGIKDADAVAALLNQLFNFTADDNGVANTSIFAVTAGDQPSITALWAHSQSAANDASIEALELNLLAVVHTTGAEFNGLTDFEILNGSVIPA